MQKEVKKYSTLAQFVSETREKLGLSQTGLAKRCNLSTEEIQGIESGIELFLSSTVRQKLSKGLKTTLSEIKLYEKKEDFHFCDTKEQSIEELKQLIIENDGNKGFAPLCPVCGNKLVVRVAKMYDLEDNLMLHPKARCSRCPFQIT
ncbi:MAG: helix-turn-helix transcriptional regulator [Candidatus Gastranaerophilales bacterium]|nr:helix-turn-helix transcriptional regulator [Candidatus Gastranaerophilales bacterium]